MEAQYRCSICRQIGHNRATCAIKLDSKQLAEVERRRNAEKVARYEATAKGRENKKALRRAARLTPAARRGRRLREQARRFRRDGVQVTPAELRSMIDAATHCECCGGKASKLVVDHDHKTKVIRGMLCAGCNVGLGCFKDSVFRCEAAARYLAHH